MKKIGILTFHASHNNGSMLQALALQHVLRHRYELDAEIIDFSNPAQKNMYAPLPQPTNWKKLIKWMIWRTNFQQLQKQYNAFSAFACQYFHLSSQSYQTAQALSGDAERYAAIIAGSDQVWNINCVDADDAYYLNFAGDVPRYAYAVSFGAHNPFRLQEREGHYQNLLKAFHRISVRERNAQKWIREATGQEVPVCLDPTMLLGREEWEALVDVGQQPLVQGEYIFYYCFSITEEIQRFLGRISRKYGMPVYFMDAKEWTLKTCWRNHIRLVGEYGPVAYMNLVKYAKLFITTSFHGTAFATIYDKCFWYIKDDHQDPDKDDRALTLLTQLGLLDRYYTVGVLDQMQLLQEKDYSEVRRKLARLRKASYAFLDSMVKEIQHER